MTFFSPPERNGLEHFWAARTAVRYYQGQGKLQQL